MLQTSFNATLLTEAWSFGADNRGIWRNDGEDFTNWRALAGLPSSSRRGSKWLVADIDKFLAHLLHQRAPVTALTSGSDHMVIKLALGTQEFISLQRFGFETTAKGLYGAKRAAELRLWLQENGWKLRTSVGGCGFYDVLPVETGLSSWAMQLHERIAPYLSSLCLAGREYCEPGIYDAVEHYDIKSAYAACARDLRLPEPRSTALIKPRTTADALRIIRTKNGAAHVKIVVPADKYGILPQTGENGIDWTQEGGTLDGVWTTIEIRYALSLGARLIRCDWCIVASKEENYLASFAESSFAEKESAKAAGDAVGGKFWKRLFNGTVGRLAADGEINTAHLVPYARPVVPVPAGFDGILAYYPYHFWLKKETFPGAGNRLWTALVVSEQRARLHAALTLSSAVYAFTDSLICLPNRFVGRCGGDLGQWELQGQGNATIRNVGTYKIGNQPAHARGIEAAAAEAALLGQPLIMNRVRKWAVDTCTRV